MISNSIFAKDRGILLLFILILTGVGSTLYSSAFLSLFSAVIHREGSSHGIFVPFLSGYLLWFKFDTIKSLKKKNNWKGAGCFFIIAGILFFLSIHTSYYLVFSILSFLCIAGGLLLAFFGTDMLKETFFPLMFLATMIPIPPEIYSQLSDWMKTVTTWGSVSITKILGVPVYRDDYYIYIPNVNLFVANSCSGIRYLLSYFVFSLVYAVLFKTTALSRCIIVTFSIPMAVVAGIARLSCIFIAAHYIHPVMAEPRPHIIISWLVFAIILFGTIIADQYLVHRIRKT